jgi:hypothetical protein
MTPVSGLSAACAAQQWSISADLDDEDGRKRKAGIEGGTPMLPEGSPSRVHVWEKNVPGDSKPAAASGERRLIYTTRIERGP